MIIPVTLLAGLIFRMVMGSTPAVATDSHLTGAQLTVNVWTSYRSEALFAGEGSVLAGEIRTLLQGMLLIEDEVCLFTRLQTPDSRSRPDLTVQQVAQPIHRDVEPLPVKLK